MAASETARGSGWRLVWLAAATLLPNHPLAAQEPAEVFRTMCAGCHTIGGGRLTGPDLKDVASRRDRPWLVRFLRNPQAMINSRDPYALKLLEESRGVVMPQIGLSAAQAEQLLKLIEEESALAKSRFVGTPLPSRPVTEADVAKGRQLFFGEQPFSRGGPACVVCHGVRDGARFGGGRWGPDLTTVHTRLGGASDGRRNLIAWLSAPGTPSMAALYREDRHPLHPDENLALTAYLQRAAEQGGRDDRRPGLLVLSLGLSGGGGLLLLYELIRRRRAAPAPLTGAASSPDAAR